MPRTLRHGYVANGDNHGWARKPLSQIAPGPSHSDRDHRVPPCESARPSWDGPATRKSAKSDLRPVAYPQLRAIGCQMMKLTNIYHCDQSVNHGSLIPPCLHRVACWLSRLWCPDAASYPPECSPCVEATAGRRPVCSDASTCGTTREHTARTCRVRLVTVVRLHMTSIVALGIQSVAFLVVPLVPIADSWPPSTVSHIPRLYGLRNLRHTQRHDARESHAEAVRRAIPVSMDRTTFATRDGLCWPVCVQRYRCDW